MKRLMPLFALLFSFYVSSQEANKTYPQDVNKKHELKIDAFSLIVFSSIDLTYERLVNKDSSYGLAVFYNFNDIDSDIYFPKKFSVTPYYRWFFTDTRYARGFFVEGFGMLNTYEDEFYDYGSSYASITVDQETNFALGISVGGKFITKAGFTAEVFAGVGRNLFNKSDYFLDNEFVTRGGITLGYRF